MSPLNTSKLLTFGITDNDSLMLSVTTINGRPVDTTKLKTATKANSQDLAYLPSEAQIKEINSMIDKKWRHPILEMRKKANKSKKSLSPLHPQVIRQITFFNREEAERERQKVLLEKKTVFALPNSARRKLPNLNVTATTIRDVCSVRQIPNSTFHYRCVTSKRTMI